MARSYGAEGIVLKRANFGESDRIITILTPYKGKITAVAKGVRKVTSRRAPNLELLNKVKLFFAKGQQFDVVTEADSEITFKSLKEDLAKVGYGFYVAEIANEFLEEGQGNKETFDLLEKTLSEIEKEKDLEKVKLVVRTFEMKFIELVGFRPSFFRCPKCNRVLSSPFFISPEVGGFLDKSCAQDSVFARPISDNAAKALRFLQNEDWRTVRRLTVNPTLNDQLESALSFYLEYLLEKELKSLRFLHLV